ncbi:MAG: DUF1816 domain-containing protein [Geminocystis sp.]|nr:DUF1816 domain-containing protein [Geminocystis sp.]MCS7148276.1 DUF1816 domain-containing protein [Geminocystis sp.]MCX8077691.1 DUF1816 domain-containing protein [Geminocystis sp.]MDW8116583.1 DUF1816 domain-containing protein [Geminocystis sp.]MDW8462237.1 DUF1816 domain-containing protein [Geminocystis sp.]
MMEVKELLLDLLDSLGWAVWLEIVTDKPQCTYYFGPFLTQQEAISHQEGYLEDLKEEKTTGITVRAMGCKPRELTVCSDVPPDDWI